MTRSFGASDLVVLPRFSVPSSLGCSAQLIAAAKGRTVPTIVAGALDVVIETRAALEKAAVAQAPQPIGDTDAGRLADQSVDGAWAGGYAILQGILRVPDDDGRHTHANALINALYPSGLDFTQLKYVSQWAESNVRLQRVDEQGLSSKFQSLGLSWLLDSIRKHHVHYGKVTGATEQQAFTAAPPQLREHFDALVDAMRDYVLKVSASVERKKPETATLAEALLAPLTQFRTARPAAAETDSETPEAEGGVV